MIYLDSGATTLQKPAAVPAAVAAAISSLASPGRGGYDAAAEAASLVFSCREAAGQLFETTPERVVFTSNATHGLNIAIKSCVKPGDHVVVSGFEHNAVIRPLAALGAKVQAAGRKLFDPADTLRAFEQAITPDTAAVVCNYVSNVFGYILPVVEIAALCARRQVPFIVDASQAAGCCPVSQKELQAAFIAMPGHKGLYGPQGTGILLCGQAGAPLLEGGTGTQSMLLQMPEELPERLEAGTMNVCGIAGLRAGLEFVLDAQPEKIAAHERALCAQAAAGLKTLPGVRTFAADNDCQSGVLSFCIEGMDCEDTAEALARRGIAVRAGLHCAPEAHRSAGTIDSGTVRASFSAFNTRLEVEEFLRQVRSIL